ncbi:MAG: homoserine O-acetyltransferase [Muribaculaceae bacterium]|nr:homoserine O-acetyltransferase [Muribaculaceae bacterium]
MKHFFHSDKPFTLECGQTLPEITITYHTYGTPNEDCSNCIWVCHALTANSDVADWWPKTVERGKFLDPEKNFIICANIIGSCYGSTGPLSTNTTTGAPWYDKFPALTIRDMAKAHILLADHLGIKRMAAIIGSSVGGFQAIEWAVEQPWRFASLVLIATDAYASPWTVAIDETQRMAILADTTYGEQRASAAASGLAAARAIGMLSYRGASGYNKTQHDAPRTDANLWDLRRAVTYQRHQGKKLSDRFDAYSYITILNAFDTHDVGRNRGGIEQALSSLTMPTIVIGITTDIIFSPGEMKHLASLIPGARYCEIESEYGHDGFLVENEALNNIILEFRGDVANI